ncbi:uncharacterized protein LOC106777384 [Vigna radiata var. radiata]|uniref:Uncharacterized protein LOC106777384 n=1 Tax=Vigna radiata var. radiata TaxID=3916 RepID=A0A1S3VQI5_VIGRR|nr:uncharacterized protein LOC106777384 [Vigna radiata var. radiata]
MMQAMLACLSRKVSRKVEEEVKVREAVYRDKLIKKKKAKKSVRFADSEASIFGEEKKEEKGRYSDNESRGKETIRVKVKMTKEEAARLLSKCKEGGVLEYKDVAHQLLALPVNRVRVLSPLHRP